MVRNLLTTAITAGAIAAAAAQAPQPSRPSQPSSATPRQAYSPPRLADGHPDLNGVWQALNEANYDIEAHNARPALAVRPGPYGPVPSPSVLALGAIGAVPPGLGVVEGGELPYRPEALAQRKQNQENWLTSDPEIKCY